MRATMVPAKMMALQRYSLKLQINRTPVSSDRQNAVSYSTWCYAIFALFDDDIDRRRGAAALGNWLFVIHTFCASLFFPTLLPLDLHAFVYAFAIWLFFDLFWMTFLFFRSSFLLLLHLIQFFWNFFETIVYSLKWQTDGTMKGTNTYTHAMIRMKMKIKLRLNWTK